MKSIFFKINSSWVETILPASRPTLMYRQKKDSLILHLHDSKKETQNDIYLRGPNLKTYLPVLIRRFQDKSKYLIQELDLTTNIELLPLAVKLSKSVEIKNRSHNFKSYKNCWISSDFGIKAEELEKSLPPEQLGSYLQYCGIVEHVARKDTFQIGYYFYRFHPNLEIPNLMPSLETGYHQVKPLDEIFEDQQILDLALEPGKFVLSLKQNDHKASVKFKISYVFYPQNELAHLLLHSLETPVLHEKTESYFGPFSLPNPGAKLHLCAEVYHDLQPHLQKKKLASGVSLRLYEHELK